MSRLPRYWFTRRSPPYTVGRTYTMRIHTGCALVFAGFALIACAARPAAGRDYTAYVTAGMDGPLTWYEQGLDPDALTTGLPHAGSFMVSPTLLPLSCFSRTPATMRSFCRTRSTPTS